MYFPPHFFIIRNGHRPQIDGEHNKPLCTCHVTPMVTSSFLLVDILPFHFFVVLVKVCRHWKPQIVMLWF